MDEWNVSRSLDHRLVNGKMEFLTEWEGFEEAPPSWKPLGNFIHRYAWELPRYCKEHKLRVDVTQYLKDTPEEEGRE